MKMLFAALALLLGLTVHEPSLGVADLPAAAQAYVALRVHGPVRFARVAPGLYRGGQPTERDLALLRQLRVRTVIDLRRRHSLVERAAVERQGMRFLNFPLSGTSTPTPASLAPIVEALRDGDAYIHCRSGRDRTSLAVALYRVRVDGWAPDRAWRHEALAYGHRGLLFRRGLEHAFRDATR